MIFAFDKNLSRLLTRRSNFLPPSKKKKIIFLPFFFAIVSQSKLERVKMRRTFLLLLSLLFTLNCVTSKNDKKCEAEFENEAKNVDFIFSGKILKFFRVSKNDKFPGLVRILTIYRGDPSFENSLIIVKGFNSSSFVQTNCAYSRRNVGDTKIFLTDEQFPGIFLLKAPLIAVTLNNLQRTRKITAENGRKRGKTSYFGESRKL